MVGKIEAYLDVVSPYSLFAFKYLLKNRPVLNSYGIQIEFHPFFLGGVNVASGNKPPWTLPAKAKYGAFDRERACKFFGVRLTETPSFFPILSIFPQRVIIYLQRHHPARVWEGAWLALWVGMWENGQDVSQPATLSAVLHDTGLLNDDEIASAVRGAGTEEIKKQLTANTEEAVKRGAYGAPWFWVTNHHGKQEPFFGSDRFTYMWAFLDLPVQELRIKSRDELGVEQKAHTESKL